MLCILYTSRNGAFQSKSRCKVKHFYGFIQMNTVEKALVLDVGVGEMWGKGFSITFSQNVFEN